MDSAFAKFFTYAFVPVFVCMILGVLGIVIWGFLSFVDKIVEGFRLGAQLRDTKIYLPSDAQTREYVLQLRSHHDAARIARMKKRRDEAAQALSANRLEGNLEFSSAKAQTNEIDVTDEVFNAGRQFLICRNPLTSPEFFHSILRGHFTERGPRDVRYTWTCVRSLGRRFGQAEAQSAIETLPGRKNLFVVPLEPDASAIAVANLRAIEKRALDSVIQTAPQPKEIRCEE